MKNYNILHQLGFIIRREYLTISTSYAILLVLIGGIFIYGLLYNFMYAPNIVTDAPVAIVDNSHSKMSRDFTRWLDATQQVEVYGQALNFEEAKSWMKSGKVQGIIYLPYNFETKVFRGDESTFSLYGTTDAFLYFEAMQRATTSVMLAINDKYRSAEASFLSPQGLAAVAIAKPITISGTPLYNFTEGYGSYLIPAVMIVIIFQTLMMVIGMVAGEEHFTHGISAYLPFGNTWAVATRIILGKTFVYISLYALFSFFLLGLLPHFFSIPNIGNGIDITLLMIPYLLATSFFGLAVSRYFTDSEAPLLMIAFFSVGLIFLSGVSYPLELMPWYWQSAHYLFPAAPAALGYVQLNSMGANLADIMPQYITLWVQVVVYFLLSVWVYKLKLDATDVVLYEKKNQIDNK